MRDVHEGRILVDSDSSRYQKSNLEIGSRVFGKDQGNRQRPGQQKNQGNKKTSPNWAGFGCA
jgi:hypothetical protein